MKTPRIAIPLLKTLTNYSEAVTLSGGEPEFVNIPCIEGFDALLLPGGCDVDPKAYNAERDTRCGNTDEELDLLQLRMIEMFVRAGKPIFGICRGLQILNVYFGGTLIQHLPNADVHKWSEEGDRIHKTIVREGSFLQSIYGNEFTTNSAHHQAIERLGNGLLVQQIATDKTIEAVSHESLPIWAVQWHPERMCGKHSRTDTVDGASIIRFFVEHI